jgi:Domain of unknown function (DUF4166)
VSSDLVAEWFGRDFALLHPLLQKLHREGGRLSGQVMVDVPGGVRGFVGRRLAARLGVPARRGGHALEVTISHRDGVLHWDRCFDAKSRVVSRFIPVGTRGGNGCWIEETDPLRLALTVDIVDGGWHWRALSARFMHVPMPLALFPRAQAYKTIVDGRYRFFVGFAVPLLGTVLSYGGDLTLSRP